MGKRSKGYQIFFGKNLAVHRETDGINEGAAGWGVIPSIYRPVNPDVAFKAGVGLCILHNGSCVHVCLPMEA